jgi:glucan 1,3-beta-glucosidase
LHGLPGSQNGFDNSGHAGDILWHTQQSNIDRSSAIIKILAAEFSQPQYASSVVAIGACSTSPRFWDAKSSSWLFCEQIDPRHLLCSHHGRMHIIQILAPMNEPAGFASSALLSAARQYWFDSYGNIRQSGTDVVEVIHDAFQDLSYWSGVMPSSGYQNVMMDTHHYEIFSDDQVAMTYQQHITVNFFFSF